MKICPVRAELLHVYRRTDSQPDMTKQLVTSHSYVNTCEKYVAFNEVHTYIHTHTHIHIK